MYAGYNLELDKQFFREWKFVITNYNSYYSPQNPNNTTWSTMFLEYYSGLGKKHLENKKKECRQKISELFLQDNILDGSAIQEEWFNTFDVDVFISHSHADEELANALAGWLNERFSFRCFIDSNIWGYFNDLIDEIIGNNTPTEQERSNVAVHVHTMLQIALQEMIDKSESVIFLNTENSMMALEEDFGERKYTLSPWIYHELVVTRLIEKKYPRPIQEGVTENFSLDRIPSIAYKPKIDHLLKLAPETLITLASKQNNSNISTENLLYALYKISKGR